jgi:hypothetical protein
VVSDVTPHLVLSVPRPSARLRGLEAFCVKKDLLRTQPPAAMLPLVSSP